ncbi:MgtC/SapB family protein [Panacibacter sp. DH6]|uniref:MgtC/SapB family protein n=1 Tax=Panacibacter microcysteis TaxID=2793269 RepID=A0A931EBM4_9BACT|nr:MgtC/SapB family protein [Panacibacter microcysteis]MBG9377641.1 MgtC/SapB family protein [Panacibacter microcysteis]
MITWQETLLRLVIASVLGALVGIERERLDWAAGLRTHMIVCLGSALMMIVSAFGFQDVAHVPDVDLDPSRVAAQVVSGIGFLGAGTILFLKNEVVKGLTTAAGLWTVAGIGLAVGGGLYIAAGITTSLVLIILVLVKPYKKKFSKPKPIREITIKTDVGNSPVMQIESITRQYNMEFTQIVIQKADKADTNNILIRFKKKQHRNHYCI